MSVIIKKITINNFGGVSHAEYFFNEKSNTLMGQSGSGKTSAYLGYLWALGCNIASWEPQINGFRISKLKTEVLVELEVNGTIYTLSKVNNPEYKIDKFTGEETFFGTGFEYLFDGQVLPLGVYKEKVAELFGVKDHFTLELLSNISLFNGEDNKRWNKDERRKFLFELFDIENKIKELSYLVEFEPIKEYLDKGKDEIEINAILNTMKSSIDKKIKSNQIIAEEKQNELAEYSGIDFDKLRTEKKEIDEKLEQLTTHQQPSSCSTLYSEKQNEINKLIVDLNAQNEANIAAKKEFDAQVGELNSQIDKLTLMIRDAKENKEIYEKKLDDLKTQFDNLNNSEFDNLNTICPTCGQTFPNDKIVELKKNFDAWKADEMKKLKKQAFGANLNKTKYEDVLADCIPSLDATKAKLQELLNIDYKKFDTSVIESVIKQKQEELINIVNSNEDNSNQDKINQLKAEQERLITEIYKEQLLNNIKARIEELKIRARELGAQDFNRLIQKQALQKFMQRKVEMVNEQVNKHFIGVKYNFFKWNAGSDATRDFVPICEAVLASSGTSFDSLSSGEQVKVNYWTNNSLRKILGINIPQFVDDCVLSDFSQECENEWQSVFLITDNTQKPKLTLIKDVYSIDDCEKRISNQLS